MEKKINVAEKEKLKEAVLVNLRSVTQSAKGGVLINRLQEDYRKLIGTTIPFQTLGYSTLEQFLNDIPHVVQIRRKTDGQLYVEAIIDASTAHLASLISKQKGAIPKTSVSKKRLRSTSWRTAGSNKPNSSVVNLDEKDKIIDDLRNTLERERNINKDFSSQLIRLNEIISAGQGALAIEQEKVRKLSDQLLAFEKNEETVTKSKEVYVKAINNLKSSLIEQEAENKKLLTKVSNLSCTNLSRITDEESLLLLISNEINVLLKKQRSDVTIFQPLNSINSTILKRFKTLKGLKSSMEAEVKQDEHSANNSSKDDNNNYSNILNLYNEQCEKVKSLENQLEQQNCAMKNLTDQIDKRFEKVYSKINKQSQESEGMKYSLAQLTNCFESLVVNQKEPELLDIFCRCQPSETENDEINIKEENSEISSVTTESIVSVAKRKKKRKKSKVVIAQSSSVYVPPHRRI